MNNSSHRTFIARLKDILNLGIAYTCSKSIDNSSSERNATDVPPNGLDARMERRPSVFDRTHIFTTNIIWYLPKLAGGGFAGERMAVFGNRALVVGNPVRRPETPECCSSR